MQVNMHEAKTHFSKLVERALAGEEVLIARNGQAVIRLSPLGDGLGPRVAGLSQGRGRIAEDFDTALPADLVSEFE